MADNEYVDLTTMKVILGDHLNVTLDHSYDVLIQDAIDSATEEITARTDRVFFQDDEVSERVFDCEADGLLLVDDISTTEGLLLNDNPLTTHYRLLPRNGVVSGKPGHPYTRIKSKAFYEGHSYKVTARWGWPEVPAPIVEAAKMIATETFLAKDTPLGVKGFNEFGAIRVRERAHIEKKLRLYARDPIGFA